MGLMNVKGKKPIKRKQHPEHWLQVDCVRWFRDQFKNYVIFSTNNECTRGKQYWKDSGMLVGVSDLVVVLPNSVLWVELKSDTGRQRPDQKHFEDKITTLGFQYHVCRTLEQFKEVVLAQVYNHN